MRRIFFGTMIAATLTASVAQADPVVIKAAWAAVPGQMFPILMQMKNVLVHYGKSYTVEAIRAPGSGPQTTALATGDISLAYFSPAAFALAIQNAHMNDLRVIGVATRDGYQDYFTRPFYDPQMWNIKSVLAATSIAVLSYIGFDGISTLSEEAENPRRNILLATVLTCFVIGILSALEVYAAQLIWPASEPFPNVDTAFTFVAQRAWAPLFAIVGFTLLVANFGSGMGAQIGAARLLYGMGRSKALPQSFFGVVDPKRHVPRNNVVFVGVIALAGALLVSVGLFSYGLGAEMLNFGALIAFMGVNLAAFVRYNVREAKKSPILPALLTLVIIAIGVWPGSNMTAYAVAGVCLLILALIAPPLAGFTICFFLWKNLSWKAWIVGGIWMLVGIAFGAWKTRGFRGDLVNFDLPPEE